MCVCVCVFVCVCVRVYVRVCVWVCGCRHISTHLLPETITTPWRCDTNIPFPLPPMSCYGGPAGWSGDLITGVYKMPLSCDHISDTSDMSCQVTYDLKICRHGTTRSLVHTNWNKLLASDPPARGDE